MIDCEALLREKIVFDFDGEAVIEAVLATFNRCGLSAVRSFDLRSALASQPDCQCPHHGTAQCNCQYAVVLVYAEPVVNGQSTRVPAVLTLHGHDGQTHAEIIRDPNTALDARLVEQIMAALLGTALKLSSAPAQPQLVTDEAEQNFCQLD